MLAVARLGLPMRVVGIVPAAENMPSARAYRPGDVVKISNGVTVEIISTDAEGRMILADALVHAVKMKPEAIIDLATLTGGCVVALGHHVTGLMSNHDELAGVIQGAGDVAGDAAWRLPITDDFREQIKSQVADCKNSGGRWGSAITAGAFLEQFVDGQPWAHLDVAGTAWTTSTGAAEKPWGATGAGVRLVVQSLLDLVERGGLEGTPKPKKPSKKPASKPKTEKTTRKKHKKKK
jgi:leucyl aminopeptidase